MNERMEKESDDGQYERNITAITKCTCQKADLNVRVWELEHYWAQYV
jgi:hypothetical protein